MCLDVDRSVALPFYLSDFDARAQIRKWDSYRWLVVDDGVFPEQDRFSASAGFDHR
jgi:hypothetical protein